MTTNEVLAAGIARHAAGDLVAAEALYQQALAQEPKHPDALHMMGRLACDAGQPATGLPMLVAAAKSRPRSGELQADLAEAYRAMGRIGEAVEAYRKAARLMPESAEIQLHYGLVLAQAGERAQALQACRRAIARAPKLEAAHTALGVVLLAAGDNAGAAAAFGVAVRLQPESADAHYNLGLAVQAGGDPRAALGQFRAATELRPDYLEAVNNVGVLLRGFGDLEDAVGWLERATRLAPAKAPFWLNYGLVLRDLCRFGEAEAAFRRADALEPTVGSLCCVGNVLRDQGRLAEAEAVLLAAVGRDAADSEAQLALAVTRMIGGDLAGGWGAFGLRGAAAGPRARMMAATGAPVWQGEELDGRLLVYVEQGAGDFVQMARFVAWAAERVGGVVLQVPAGLARLAGSVSGAAMVLTAENALPKVAAICADVDLPRVFGVSLETVPRVVPYLAAPDAEAAAWAARLAGLPGRRVGLAWQGNPAYIQDRQRSIPVAALERLQGVAGISFVSLQPGGAAPGWMVDWSGELGDFAATAALTAGLDLVIAVDSAVAHLAGALGRPVWLLNRCAPDWRWMLGREDSPWYPTLRQFRQTVAGDWEAPIAEVRRGLNAGW
jgi:tetratricopeptide (TPR) repeat protein